MPPATAPRISRPHRHTAVLPMDGSERRCQRLQETFRRTASCRRADHGKSCRHFALVSRGHRSDRTPPRESPRHFAARMDESVIVGYYTSAEVHPRSPARLLLSKERKKPMARNDGIDRTFARNQDLPTLDDVAKVQEHNEREKDSYSNQDIDTTQTHRNVHFKKPTDSYAAMFDQMIADGVISTRGLKADAVKYGELLFDVNSAYFHNHGGYEYAKQFYADAYKAAVEIVGGEQYILSAVMHADERNRAMSEALGEDVYHYHLHVVYIPVVEKQILWSKRCKDEFLRGTVKETITQVSRSKKWESKAEQERLKLEIEVIEEWVEQREEMNDGLDAFIALTQKYVDVEELTQTIVNEYIKKIVVYAPDKSSGKRKQKVKIFFNFVDDVDIPVISEPIVTQTTYERRKTA